MSLFSELYALTKARRIAMLVTSDHETGLMTISVMPRPLNDNDAPFCKDLTLTAPPDEFDAGFLEAIATYRDKLLPLLEQAKAAGAAIDKASQSAAQRSAAKSAAKSPAAKDLDRPSKAATPESSRDEKAREYREASDGEATPDVDPDTDWMKNRQPELF